MPRCLAGIRRIASNDRRIRGFGGGVFSNGNADPMGISPCRAESGRTRCGVAYRTVCSSSLFYPASTRTFSTFAFVGSWRGLGIGREPGQLMRGPGSGRCRRVCRDRGYRPRLPSRSTGAPSTTGIFETLIGRCQRSGLRGTVSGRHTWLAQNRRVRQSKSPTDRGASA